MSDAIKKRITGYARGAATLGLAYVGVVTAGLGPEVHIFAEGAEAVVVGRKGA